MSTWTTGDRINAALLLVAVVAIIMTWWQARSSAKTQRATFLKDLYATLNTDDGIREAFYLIEYGDFKYGPDFHLSKQEPHVDRLLSFVDLVCELYFRRTITRREMRFFDYRFRRIARNSEVQKYLAMLRDVYASTETRDGPFPSFGKYIRNLGTSPSLTTHTSAPREAGQS